MNCNPITIKVSPQASAASSNSANLKHDRNAFDILRLAAALIVLLSHSFLLLGQSEPTLLGNSLGTLAVQIFLAISGYLVCGSWLRDPRVIHFAIRRILRIYPGLVAAAALLTLAVGAGATTVPLLQYLADADVWSYFADNAAAICSVENLPGVFNQLPVTTVNGSLWSIRYELLLYVLFVLLAVSRSPKLAFTAAFILLSGAWLLAANTTSIRGVFNPLSGFPALWRIDLNFALSRLVDLGSCFCGGVLLYLLRESIKFSVILAVTFVAVIALVPATLGTPALAAVLPYAAITMGRLRPHPVLSLRGWDISYGVYIYGYPIQQLVTQFCLGRGYSWGTAFLLAAMPTAVMGMLSWQLVERPALKLKQRLAPVIQA